MQIHAESVVMLSAPDYHAEATSEALYGEHMTVLQEHIDSDADEWVYARNETDAYEGYLPKLALSDECNEPTHRVSELRTFLYEEPNFKAAPLASLSFMSRINTTDVETDDFVQLNNGVWIWKSHVCALKETNDDIATTAEKFLGTPYLWGGRTSLGLDCSALVQLALLAAGHDCPRDSGDQMAAKIGKDIKLGAKLSLKRGDIVFFKGHVGIMIDGNNLINATARKMKVCVESLDDVIEHYDGVLAVKRIS
jgi:cell wall-associated NlpC family hydrolase